MTDRERLWWQDGWRNGYGVATDADPLLPGPLRPDDLALWRRGVQARWADRAEDRAGSMPSWARGLL